MAEPAGDPHDGVWPYLGVGCLTAVVGLLGGGMLGVAVAKAASMAQHCTNEADPRSPCNWTGYWTWGARIGLILLPTFSLWRMRRARKKEQTKELS